MLRISDLQDKKIRRLAAARDPDEKTVVSVDGLRYESKVNGSGFAPVGSFGLMSCLKCGKHKPRSQLVHKKILGASHLVCIESCKRAS